MRQAIAIIRNTVFLVVAALFLLTVVWAQFICSLNSVHRHAVPWTGAGRMDGAVFFSHRSAFRR